MSMTETLTVACLRMASNRSISSGDAVDSIEMATRDETLAACMIASGRKRKSGEQAVMMVTTPDAGLAQRMLLGMPIALTRVTT